MTTANNKGKSGIILLLAAALVVGLPLSFYLIAKIAGKDKLAMPRFYDAEGVKTPGGKDTLYHQVAELNGINQLGDRVGLNKNLQGKMLVVDFFFATCPTICPRLTRNMLMLEKAYHRTPMMRNDTLVQFISITVTPEIDSFQALRKYADHYGADNDHWWFITGNKKALYNYARNELHVETPEGDSGADDFIHTQQIVLLDKSRHIRGKYDGLDTAGILRCAYDIGLLAMEKKPAVTK